MSWNRLCATWTWFVLVGAGLLPKHLPVSLRRLVGADLGGDDHPLEGDPDGDHRGVDQVAIRVREDRELPAAIARLGQCRRDIVEHRPGRKRPGERAGLSLGKRQALLLCEALESEREHLAIRGPRLRSLNLGLQLVEAREQIVCALHSEQALELGSNPAVPVHERPVAVECRPPLSHAAKPRGSASGCSLVTDCY